MPLTAATTPLHEIQADWLIVPTWEDGLSAAAQQLDRRLDGRMSRLRETQDAAGKPNELVPLFDAPGVAAKRILLLGLGKKQKLTRWLLARAATTAGKYICGK